MIIVKIGQGCGGRPLISDTVGKRKDGTRKRTTSVEDILCALFCGESKEKILKENTDMTEQDFEDALTFAMYAVSQFNGKLDLAWDRSSLENYWAR